MPPDAPQLGILLDELGLQLETVHERLGYTPEWDDAERTDGSLLVYAARLLATIPQQPAPWVQQAVERSAEHDHRTRLLIVAGLCLDEIARYDRKHLIPAGDTNVQNQGQEKGQEA